MSSTNAVGNGDGTEVPAILIDMIEPVTCARRFFFQRWQDYKFTASEILQHPVPIKNGGNFEVPITTGGLLPGWYCAVFCVSLDHLEGIKDKLDKMTFDVTSKEMITGILCQDYTCKTILEENEIASLLRLPRTEPTRLKLHRQIEVRSDTDLSVSINVKTVLGCEEDISFDLHYFELACPEACSKDHVLWGEGKPDQFIRIGHASVDFVKRPIAIEACDISISGSLAVTVYISPAISDVRIPDGTRGSLSNIAARIARVTDRACTPESDRASDRAYTIDRSSIRTVDRGSVHTTELTATHGLDQALPHAYDQAASLAPHDHSHNTQPHSRPLNQGHSHSNISDNIYASDQGRAHTPTGTPILGVAHIQVWDLSTPPERASSDDPQPITIPVSSLSVLVPALRVKKPSGNSHKKKTSDDCYEKNSPGDSQEKTPPSDSHEKNAPEDPPQPPRPTINISNTGLHIILAVGWEATAVHAAPFLIYRTEQNPPEHYKYARVLKVCQEIQNSFGFGAFHSIDQDDPNSENERFFKIYGSQLDIYSTTGGWKQLHSLTFGIKGILPTPRDMFYLTESLRGRYFAWTGDRGSVAIWDFETGKHVTTILIPKDKRGVCAALSEDGSMVAITVNGHIQVHDVASGIKLGVCETKWKEDNGSEIIFRQDYFMALDAARSTSGNKNIDARSIFRVRDMKVVKTHHVFWQYGAMFSSTLNPVFAYKQGVIVNIKRLGNILSPNEHNDCTPTTECAFDDIPLNLIDDTWTGQNPSSAGITFGLECDNSSSGAQSIQKLVIAKGLNKVSLSLGPVQESRHCSGFHVASSSQLVLILNGFLQVWSVPFADGQPYELVHVEAFVVVPKVHANDTCITRASAVQSCTHGRKFIIDMKPIEWHSDTKKPATEDDPENDEGEDDQETEEAKGGLEGEDSTDGLSEEQRPDNDQMPWRLTFPRAPEVTVSTTEKYRCENGIVSLLDTYADSDEEIKEAIIRFLADRIRPSSENTASSLQILCRAWKYSNRATLKMVLAKLLPESGSITWIPDIHATTKEDPLSILLTTAKKYPTAFDACKIIMNYCIAHAIESKNTSFLSPFLRSLKRIMKLHPDEAQGYLRRIAYIPVGNRQRDFILENSTVIHPPWHCILFRNTTQRLDKIKKPVMQLHVTSNGPRIKADTFNRPIHVASFDALWHLKADPVFEKQVTGELVDTQRMTAKLGWTSMIEVMIKRWSVIVVGSTVQQQPATIQESVQESALEVGRTKQAMPKGSDGLNTHGVKAAQETTWWKTAYHMLRLKCRLKTHTYVVCHDFNLEFLDNPAIAALVAYKWNTIGYAYWAFRFFFQCAFYALVFVAALLQVYDENVGRRLLGGVFVAIIVVGAVFLWLELLQAIKNFKRYRRNPYNLLDIVAYSLPMIASFIMLMVLYDIDVKAKSHILSYSVLAVFMHMLFELRIYKSVCKYVTIIRQSVLEIRVFFLIFAGGLVAFTITFLHLLQGCLIPGTCADPETKYSKHFGGALSATYFFMGGRFDPINDELDSENWAFHVVMAIYFFFTVIIMLNVLIALINKAFTKGDDDWRLDWIESRLRYIELAENLSYHIPGFRETHNWFPKEIYFADTEKEVKEYSKEALETQVQKLEERLTKQEEQIQKQLTLQKEQIQQQLTLQQEQAKRQFQELKDFLLNARSEGSYADIENNQ
ncbi:unnamed protein product [Mortierella alpina]